MIESFAHVGKDGRFYTIHSIHPEPSYEVMQSTGLLDKNGVEIYEGDVLGNGKPNIAIEVGWKYGSFTAGNLLRLGEMIGDPNIEVIGNIYANPELLTPLKESL